MFSKTTNFGNPFIGLFAACNDELALIGPASSDKLRHALAHALGGEVIITTIVDSDLIGLFCALNSNGIIVPDSIYAHEKRALKKAGLNVCELGGRLNACGCIIACNDRGALVHEELTGPQVRMIADALGVEAVKGSLAHYRTVGASCLATNTGFVAHNDASEEEMKMLEGVLKVRGINGTANLGTSFVRLCAVANSNGCVAGEKTSGFELARIEEGLNLAERAKR